ncbi:MAG: response regulator [bacterium]|nr:response regulator [bacterium]
MTISIDKKTGGNGRGQQKVILTKDSNRYNPGLMTEFLEDKDGTIPFDDILSGKYSGQFIRNTESNLNFGFTQSAYWIAFAVKNHNSGNSNWHLEVGYPHLDDITLYYPGRDGTYKTKTGSDKRPFKEREILYRNFIFKLNIEQGKESIFFLRIQTESSFQVPLTLWEPGAFIESANDELFGFGIFYGIMLVMILYNCFIFFGTRDKIYIYYALFISTSMLGQMSLNGLAFKYIWFDWPGIMNETTLISLSISASFMGIFCRKYLNTKKNLPVIDKIFIILIAASLGGGLSSFLVPYYISAWLTVLMGIIPAFVALIAGIVSLKKGIPAARLFMPAWFLLLMGIILLSLTTYGLLPRTFVTIYTVPFGFAAEVILLSLGLAERINHMRKERYIARELALSSQKKMVEQLRENEKLKDEMNKGLEEKVQQRTEELESATEKLMLTGYDLAQANEKLKEMDKLKSNFFANISHEIRTPLTLMLSPIESVIQEEYGKEIDKGFFRNLRRNGIHLLHLINNLLDFSKIEEGRMHMKVKELNIIKVLKSYITFVRSSTEIKGVDLTFKTQADSLKLCVDMEKFDKICMNLFSNALKFTDTGGMIEIRAKEDSENCYLAIEDTGVGIPPGMTNSIFDRFRQVDTGMNRKYEGTGIGLSLAKEYIELHGGTITVKSKYIKDYPEDHGTIFTLTLPKGKAHFEGNDRVEFITESELSKLTADSKRFERVWEKFNFSSNGEGMEPGNENAGVTENNSENNYDKETVLIVEDNPDMIDFLVNLLGKEYNTASASNGKEALEMMNSRSTGYDLVLADVMMPEMDGYELTKAIRSDEKFLGIPVILLTARTDDLMKVEGFKMGATDYITKPFNPGELLLRIRSQMELKRLRDRLLSTNKQLYAKLEKSFSRGKGPLLPQTEEKIEKVIDFIKENYVADISREGLAAAVDLSPDHLGRIFKKHTGKKISEYINELRIKDAADKLRHTDKAIVSIAHETGFECLRTFNRSFQKIMGTAPSDFRLQKE